MCQTNLRFSILLVLVIMLIVSCFSLKSYLNQKEKKSNIETTSSLILDPGNYHYYYGGKKYTYEINQFDNGIEVMINIPIRDSLKVIGAQQVSFTHRLDCTKWAIIDDHSEFLFLLCDQSEYGIVYYRIAFNDGQLTLSSEEQKSKLIKTHPQIVPYFGL